jgi:hypothetical protein
MIDFCDDDVADLLAERQARRYYQRQLLNHPDPRDPDYPEPTEGEDE